MSASVGSASAAPRRRGRPRSDELSISEDQVLTAALGAFATKGYEGMSVRDLNKELGVSHNLVHRRFGSKSQLWEATVDRWFTEFTEQLHPVLDAIEPGQPLEAFRSFIVAFIEVSAARPELLRLMMFEGASEGPRIDYIWEQHFRPFGRRVREVVSSLDGNERYTMIPQSTVFFLLAHGATAAPSHRSMAVRLDHEDPADPDVLRRHANAVADLLFGIDPTTRLRRTRRTRGRP